MSQFNEVAEPIICDAYSEPRRREACYYCRLPGRSTGATHADEIGTRFPLDLVNDVASVWDAWRGAGTPGVGAVTGKLLAYWTRDERRLFFCQREDLALATLISVGAERRGGQARGRGWAVAATGPGPLRGYPTSSMKVSRSDPTVITSPLLSVA